ncbi:MAG TPA: c-type cytochrome [Longimicrobiales bacterium]
MRRVLKWLGIGTGSLAGIALVAAGAIYAVSARRMAATWDVTPAELTVPDDSAAIARGRHFTRAIAKCMDCHRPDYSGKVVIDDPMLGRIAAPNITPAGITRDFTTADWVRAIRHGVRSNGRSVVVMPSFEYYHISDADLADMIAYLRSLRPVANDSLPPTRIGPMGRFLIATSAFPVLSASAIDHAAPHPGAPTAAPTPEYGQYLASIGCVGCHGTDMKGGKPPAPPAPDLTPTGKIAGWTESDFRTALRSGKRPDGTVVGPDMPWPLTSEMTDMEISAVWAYLQSLGPASVASQGR